MVKTTQQQLEEVQAAIEQVLASQEMGSGADSVKRPSLKVLYDREDQLLRRLESETGVRKPALVTGLFRGQ